MKNAINWFTSLCAFVAVLLSWAVNQSIWWAIFHCICGSIYIAYWLIKYTECIDWISQWVVK